MALLDQGLLLRPGIDASGWNDPGRFPLLQQLDLSGNSGLTGPLPFPFCDSIPQAQVMLLADCSFKGTASGPPDLGHSLQDSAAVNGPGMVS